MATAEKLLHDAYFAFNSISYGETPGNKRNKRRATSLCRKILRRFPGTTEAAEAHAAGVGGHIRPMGGGRFIAPEVLERIADQPEPVALTPRERQTLHMVLQGRTTKEIADAQGISPRTAEKHRASLMGKLQVKSVAELMAL